jgi:hypothetical protein
MLMRTDPFRDLDRLTQQVLGTMARPAATPSTCTLTCPASSSTRST